MTNKEKDYQQASNEMWNAIREMLTTSTEHVNFLARNCNDFKTNLQSISESLEMLSNFTRSLQTALNNRLINVEAKRCVEFAEKNRLYAYLLANGETDAYQRFCINNPLQDFENVTGVELIKKYGV